MAASNLEFQWLVDRTSSQWTAGFNEDGVPKTGASIHLFNSDPWSSCLVEFLNPERLPTLCPSAILHSWPTGLPWFFFFEIEQKILEFYFVEMCSTISTVPMIMLISMPMDLNSLYYIKTLKSTYESVRFIFGFFILFISFLI